MGERETILKAESAGRKAFWDNIPREQNPLRSKLSRQAWFSAWDEEESRNNQELDRMSEFFSENPNYYCDLSMDDSLQAACG